MKKLGSPVHGILATIRAISRNFFTSSAGDGWVMGGLVVIATPSASAVYAMVLTFVILMPVALRSTRWTGGFFAQRLAHGFVSFDSGARLRFFLFRS